MRDLSLATVLSLAVLTVGVARPLWAEEQDSTSVDRTCPHGYAPKAMNVNVEALGQQLNLSQAQIDKIRTIIDDNSTPLYALREKIHDNYASLSALHQAEPLDAAAIRKLEEKQASILADLTALGSKTRTDIHAVLTPEQQEQLRQLHHTDTQE
ncbi:MAG: Spy/CpxP family protein refolding chaperone [Gammaproteobacteria bacterium]|nr:Spy/CpxP family protein refolding chaperone [Gammaproteobacteria bacterium]